MIARAVLLLFISASMAFSQSTAMLKGSVTDPTGAVIPGAQILVRNQATAIERPTLSDETGNYQVPALPVGVYTIEVKLPGMQQQVVKDLELEVGQTVVRNFKLEVGNVTEVVSVTGESPMVDTATITVGQVISSKTVQEIPLNGRHFLDMGMLIPGSVTPPANAGLAAPLRGQGFFGFNTAGAREDGVNFMINGINLNDISNQQITFQPSINTVDEFKVNNSTFSAEFGRNSGAIANVATKSGTNEFHGEVFNYFRNSALDARNFFDGVKPPFHRNQYGGVIGGPILKDRTFFFYSYEGLIHHQGISLVSGVLTDAQRALVTDPVIAKLLPLIPVANSGPSTFQGPQVAPVGNNQMTIDVNHRLSGKDIVHVYYADQRDDRKEPTAQGTETVPGWGDDRTAQRQIFTFNETHTLSPTIVNEARMGFNRIHITFIPNANLNPADYGINNGINYNIALPTITVQGISLTIGGPGLSGRGVMTAGFADSVSVLKREHSIKFGVEFRPSLSNNFSTSVGSFTFASPAAFIADTANAFTQTLGNTSTADLLRALGAFVQDNYKFRSNLTFDIGLRWDWNMTPKERYNKFIIFDPAADGLVRVGAGLDKVYRENAKNFQPRVGFAWDPTNSGKTSIRGGYAILTEQPRDLLTGLAGNPPLATPVALPAGTTTTLSRALTDVQASGTIAPTSVDKNFDNAYTQSYNLNIQHELGPGIGLSIGYYSSKGTHLEYARNLNQLTNGVRPYARLSSSSTISPNVGLTNISQRESGGNSSYNALWLVANKRFARGLSFNTSYTFSKSIDVASTVQTGVTGGTAIQDAFNVRGSRGLSNFDARHRFVISALYELPLHGNRLFDGWQISPVIQDQTGNPLTILSGSTSTTNINNLTGAATIRPDLIAPVQLVRGPAASSPGVQWFNGAVCDPTDPNNCPAGASFAIPVSFVGNTRVLHFGNLGRNALTGPGFHNVDFSVLKNTKITETTRAQFRAEIFDLFNHANFGNPNLTATPGSTTFGVIQSTRFPTGESGSSRQVQLTLKIIF
jgi:hypothetical protein